MSGLDVLSKLVRTQPVSKRMRTFLIIYLLGRKWNNRESTTTTLVFKKKINFYSLQLMTEQHNIHAIDKSSYRRNDISVKTQFKLAPISFNYTSRIY